MPTPQQSICSTAQRVQLYRGKVKVMCKCKQTVHFTIIGVAASEDQSTVASSATAIRVKCEHSVRAIVVNKTEVYITSKKLAYMFCTDTSAVYVSVSWTRSRRKYYHHHHGEDGSRPSVARPLYPRNTFGIITLNYIQLY